ncbi:ABC transporter permease [Agrobacterium rosae]|uniref:ABC transporter permease n=1 Tax=Agrobacterium rosae TaxID=1972867 RepID=UPI001FD464BD|nr:capsular biosynthesis protein [Agrobacterium rosae]
MLKKTRNRSRRAALKQSLNVMNAVVLRDIRTRFFDHGLGFLIVPLWPLAHLLILLLIYQLAGRQTPYGTSLNVFFATGLIPTLLFMYVSRFMALSVLLNKPMLSFPAVHVFDILAARAFLETIAAALTLFMTILLLWLYGDNPWPFDLEQAVLAYLSTLALAIGVGAFVGVLTMFFPIIATAYALLMICVYISSGTLFVASNLPSSISTPLAWNPIFHCVEWMRTAYFETYSDRLLDRYYPVSFGVFALFIALVLERVFRRVMIE